MLPRLILAVAVVAMTPSSSFAQDNGAPIQRWPSREAQPAPSQPAPSQPAPAAPERIAVPRQPSPAAAAPAPQPSQQPERVAQQRREPPQGRGDRVAVPRRGPAPDPRDRDRDRNDRDRDRGRTNVYVVPRPLPYGAYAYRRDYYPYGYGAFGLGYFYYDPYTWYSRAPIYSYGPGAYGSGYYGRGYNYDIGEVRLRVTPREAQVFIDGYFAGVVDDYDGILQALRLESGPYHVELRAPGYQTEQFDIRINPGQKITYRAELRRLP
jgi:hypothetical protein